MEVNAARLAALPLEGSRRGQGAVACSFEVEASFVDHPTNGPVLAIEDPAVPSDATHLVYFIDNRLYGSSDVIPGAVFGIPARRLPATFTLQVVATRGDPMAGADGGSIAVIARMAVAASPRYELKQPSSWPHEEVVTVPETDPPPEQSLAFAAGELPPLEVRTSFADRPTSGLSLLIELPAVPEEATHLAYIIDGDLDSIRDIVPGRVQDIPVEGLPDTFTLQVVATDRNPTAGLARDDITIDQVPAEVARAAIAASPEQQLVVPGRR